MKNILQMNDQTANEAKRLIAAELDKRGFSVTLSAVGFSDLARPKCIFITIAGYPFDGENGPHTNIWHNELKPFAVSRGFRITAISEFETIRGNRPDSRPKFGH